jgi:hypothetical protein
MKKIILFILILFCFVSSFAQYMPAEKHFKIYARVSDNKFFYDLQKELNINPVVANYLIYVNTYFQTDEYLRKEEDNLELDLGNNSRVIFPLNSLSENTKYKLFDLKNPNEFIESNEQTMWSYFIINANSADDSLFVWLQNGFNIESSYMEKYQVIVDLRSLNPEEQTITISDNKRKYKKLWNDLNYLVQYGLIYWTGTNKINLNRKSINYSTPITNNISELKNNNLKFIKPEKSFSKILKSSLNHFKNNYLQMFGGENVGIPISENVGFIFGTGTKYSGPLESNQISAGISAYGFSLKYITRISNFQNDFADKLLYRFYNNISARPAFEINADIPFGDYLTIGYLKTLDDKYFYPAGRYYLNGDNLFLMPDNVMGKDYFNFELRYPIVFLNSEKANIYFGYYMKEVNLGFYSRESDIANSTFDFRTNFTLTQIRNFQILTEFLISGFSNSFGMNSIAIGPSFRFSKLENDKFGLHTLFLNLRLKIGA